MTGKQTLTPFMDPLLHFGALWIPFLWSFLSVEIHYDQINDQSVTTYSGYERCDSWT